MYLVTHAAIGATVAAAVTNEPAAAFCVGWLMHYVGDFVPHGDEPVGDWTRRGHEIFRFALIAGLDASILAFAVSWHAARHGWSWALFAAVVGSCVPDVSWGLEKVFDRKLFGPHQEFHHRVHDLLGVRLPLWLGLAGQTLLASALWYFLLR